MSSAINKFICFIIFNVILLVLLYNIPTDSQILNNICIIKLITGKSCWNCGMTRAFLSILHFQFDVAYQFNHNVVIVFPLTVGIYLYSWYKYIIRKKGDERYERKR